MSVTINCRTTAVQRLLRTGTAVLATAILSGIGVTNAVAEPLLPLPSLCGYSAPAPDAGPEVEAIQQLKANYFANIDAKNWDGVRGLLAADVVVDTTCSAGPVFYGRGPFIAFLKLTLGGATTHHRGYDSKIKLTSATTAEGLWAMDDVLIFGGTLGVHGYGHYSDRYSKVDGKWVVKYSKLTRTRFDLVDPGNGAVIQSDVPLAQVADLIKGVTGQ